jgi:hypothetical protein
MTSRKVAQALSNLCDFRPAEWGPGAELTPEDRLKKREEVNDLIRLGARLHEALDGRALTELSSRAAWLDGRIGPGTPFSAAWQAVRPLLGKPRRKADRDWPEQASDILTCPETHHVLFPVLLAGALAVAEGWLEDHPEPPEHAAFRRWRNQLYKVSVEAERRHFWGSYLLSLCGLAKDPECPQCWLYEVLVASFQDRVRVARAMQEAAKDLVPAVGRPPSPRATHSADFRSIDWFGRHYSFTPGQAACMKIMWNAWEQGAPEMAQQRILGDAGLDSERLVDLFKGRPAWGTMIVPGATKGAFRLQEPTPPSA